MVPEKFDIEKHAGFLRPYYQPVYDFIVADLAGIFSRCVECRVVPRRELDEKTATELVNRRVLGDPVIYEMIHWLLHLKAFEIERPGQISPEIINRDDGYREHFLGIVNFLATLNKDHVEYLLNRAAAEIQWDYDFTKRVLGQWVWRYFYRPEFTCMSGNYDEKWPGYKKLPVEYGEVWFG